MDGNERVSFSRNEIVLYSIYQVKIPTNCSTKVMYEEIRKSIVNQVIFLDIWTPVQYIEFT